MEWRRLPVQIRQLVAQSWAREAFPRRLCEHSGLMDPSCLHLPVPVDQIRIERYQRPLRIDGHLVEDGAENCSFSVQAVVGHSSRRF